jgi:hypothetical protein
MGFDAEITTIDRPQKAEGGSSPDNGYTLQDFYASPASFGGGSIEARQEYEQRIESSGGAPGLDFRYHRRFEILARDLEIVVALEIQPEFRAVAEV